MCCIVSGAVDMMAFFPIVSNITEDNWARTTARPTGRGSLQKWLQRDAHTAAMAAPLNEC